MRSLSLTLILLLAASAAGAAGNDAAVAAAESAPLSTAASPDGSAASEDPAASFFETTTVTAVGREVDVFEVATPVTVLPLRELERRLVTQPADLLRDQPGVDVNGIGLNQVRPVIRGQRGLRVLFLADGLRMNNARRQTDFGEITGLFDTQDLEAVEIVRGPAAVLYGSDAVGGVFNVVTRRAPLSEGIGASVEARYGTAGDLARIGASAEGRSGRFGWRLGGSWRDADDYEAPSGRFGSVRLRESVPVVDSGVQDEDLDLGVETTLGATHTLRLQAHRYRADETGFGLVEPRYLEASPTERVRIYYPFQDFDRYAVSWSALGTEAFRSFAQTLDVRLFRQTNDRRLVNDIFSRSGPVTVSVVTDNYTDLETTGLRLDAVRDFGAGTDRAGLHLLHYGFDCTQDDSSNTDASRITIRLPGFTLILPSNRANTPNATNDSCGVFAQDEFAVGERFKFSAGLRWQDVETQAEPTPGWNVAGLDFSDRQTVGAVSATYSIRPELNAFASWGTAFRAPNIVERLFNGVTPEGSGYQVLNRDLASEESDNLEFGIKYRRSRSFLEAVAFRTDIDQGIVQYYLTPAEIAALPADVRAVISAARASYVVQQRNIDRLRYEGIEIALGHRFPVGVVVGGNYTHLSGERIDSANPPTGDNYADKVSAYARYEPSSGRYWVEYRLRHNGSADASLQPGEPTPIFGRRLPSFTVHNLAGGVRLFDGMAGEHSLLVEAANLTDELYAEFSNASFFRPEAERRFTAAWRVRF